MPYYFWILFINLINIPHLPPCLPPCPFLLPPPPFHVTATYFSIGMWGHNLLLLSICSFLPQILLLPYVKNFSAMWIQLGLKKKWAYLVWDQEYRSSSVITFCFFTNFFFFLINFCYFILAFISHQFSTRSPLPHNNLQFGNQT